MKKYVGTNTMNSANYLSDDRCIKIPIFIQESLYSFSHTYNCERSLQTNCSLLVWRQKKNYSLKTVWEHVENDKAIIHIL